MEKELRKKDLIIKNLKMKEIKNTMPSLAPDFLKEARKELIAHLKSTPIPDNELLQNLGTFITPALLKKIFLLDELYQKDIKCSWNCR